MTEKDILCELLAIKLYEMRPIDHLKWYQLAGDTKEWYRETVRRDFNAEAVYKTLAL